MRKKNIFILLLLMLLLTGCNISQTTTTDNPPNFKENHEYAFEIMNKYDRYKSFDPSKPMYFFLKFKPDYYLDPHVPHYA